MKRWSGLEDRIAQALHNEACAYDHGHTQCEWFFESPARAVVVELGLTEAAQDAALTENPKFHLTEGQRESLRILLRNDRERR